MRKIFLLTYLFFIPAFLFSQVDTAWVRRYNGPGNDWDETTSLFVDGQGNVYVTGRSVGSGTGYDYATLKYNTNGNLLWERRYNGPGNDEDIANALFVDGNGNVYVTGYSVDSGANFNYTTLKYDGNGNLLWERRYDGPENSVDWATSLAVDINGNVYVTGHSVGIGWDYATLKYDRNGNLLWERRYNGPGNDEDIANALFVDGNGNVYVTGYSVDSGANEDYLTLKYDGNGNLLWERRYNGPVDSMDFARVLFVDGAGNVYVTGRSIDSGTYYDYLTLKYDRDGNLLWERRYNGPANWYDEATSLAVDDNGNVYVTGGSYGSGTSWDYATLKYDRNGNLLWQRRYNGQANSMDVATSLAVDGNGNIYVTGYSFQSGTLTDYLTLKYDADGNLLWEIRYNGSANNGEEAKAIAVGDNGNVYVTGYSIGSGTNYDYATIKYVQGGSISEGKENKIGKRTTMKTNKIYDITGKFVKENKLKKGVYFIITKKENKKIIILK